jgi:error-prone DNA polymerase
MKHIGMDVHSTTTDACVRNGRGKIVFRQRIRTTKKELEAFIGGIQGPKRVALEESQMADWVARVLMPHVAELIRCQPQHNRLISESEDKCDKADAEALSELLYLNRLKAVHHPAQAYRNLREAVRAYWIASREVTRAKNRIKAYFLFNGLHELGASVYSVRKRKENLQRLKKHGINVELGRLLYERMDDCRQLKAKHIALMRQTAEPFKDAVRLLTTIPGIGKVSAYTLLAYLEDGRRIPNKRKLWRYAGLSLRKHESRDLGTRGASYTGNRLLKLVVMAAAITVVSRPEVNGLSRLWERDIRKNVDPKRARRNLARKIIVIAHQLLRSKQEYKDELITA